MIVLGLGSNLGDRLANLSAAIRELSKTLSDINTSSIYESDALLKPNSPTNWNIKFLNVALSATTKMEPLELLELIKNIEKKLGRKQNQDTWSPREIDIDILVFNDKSIQSKKLTIPHKELLNRDFFIIPMSEIAPDYELSDVKNKKKNTINNIGRYILSDPAKTNNLQKTDLQFK